MPNHLDNVRCVLINPFHGTCLSIPLENIGGMKKVKVIHIIFKLSWVIKLFTNIPLVHVPIYFTVSILQQLP